MDFPPRKPNRGYFYFLFVRFLSKSDILEKIPTHLFPYAIA